MGIRITQLPTGPFNGAIDSAGLLSLEYGSCANATQITVTDVSNPSASEGYTVYSTWRLDVGAAEALTYGRFSFPAASLPGSPPENKLRFYTKDNANGPLPDGWMPLDADPLGDSDADGETSHVPAADGSPPPLTRYLSLARIP